MPHLPTLMSLLAMSCLPAQAAEATDVEWRIQVVHADGRAFEGVSVLFRKLGAGIDRWTAAQIHAQAVRVTDASGRAAWPVDDSNGNVWIAAPGHIPLLMEAGEFAEWNGVVDLGRVVLHPGRPLLARVRGPGRIGIKGVQAMVLPNEEIASSPMSLRTHLVAETDASGILKIPAIPEGAFNLYLSHADYVSKTIPCVTPRSPLDIVMDSGASVSGRVLAADGSPADGGFVEARTEIGRSFGMMHKDGTFTVRVPTGVRYRMVFSGAAREPRLVGPIRIGSHEGVDWTVPSIDASEQLEVRCVGASGGAVDDFAVMADWREEHGSTYGAMALSFRGAVESVDGVAHLDLPRQWSPGRGVLRIRAAGHGETYVPVRAPADGVPTDPVVATLQARVVVQGRVLDEDTGEPLPGVKVWGTPFKEGAIGYRSVPGTAVETDDQGFYQVADLSAGTWTLEVHRPGWFRPFRQELLLDPGREPVVTMPDVTLAAPGVGNVQIVGIEEPERWFVTQWIESDNRRMGFLPQGGLVMRPAAALVEPSPWRIGSGDVRVSVVTTSGGTIPYAIRLPATWEPAGANGSAKVVVSDGRICRVGGRWRTTDYAFVERLGVRAHPLTQGARGGHGEIRADGTWSFEVTPGPYEFRVVDLATKIELWRSEQIQVELDVEEIDVNPVFEPVTIDYVLEDPDRPMPSTGAVLVDGPRKFNLPRELEILLLPPREIKLSMSLSSPGQLNEVTPFRLESQVVESLWQPGMERWTIEVPEPLSDEELLQPAKRAGG